MDLLDIVFPKKCVNCGQTGNYVCHQCQVGLWEQEQICPVCRRASQYGQRHSRCSRPYALDGLVGLWAYEGIAKQLIKKAKYQYYYDTLKFLLANFDFLNNPQFISFQRFLNTGPVVAPVPLPPQKERERGFNQAAIIAEVVALQRQLVYHPHLLRRSKDTGYQTLRSRDPSWQVVTGAFSINPQISIPNFKSVLLVDDVWKTGATLSECTKLLKQAGIKDVWALVLAR